MFVGKIRKQWHYCGVIRTFPRVPHASATHDRSPGRGQVQKAQQPVLNFNQRHTVCALCPYPTLPDSRSGHEHIYNVLQNLGCQLGSQVGLPSWAAQFVLSGSVHGRTLHSRALPNIQWTSHWRPMFLRAVMKFR